MTRRGRCRARVVVYREAGPLPVTGEGLVMALTGRWQVTDALSPATGARAEAGADLDTTWALGANQGLWWQDGGGPVHLRPEVQHGQVALLAVSIEREHA
jgi:environmental stress-induced protein Ves